MSALKCPCCDWRWDTYKEFTEHVEYMALVVLS